LEATLVKGLKVLEALAGRAAPAGVTELAGELDLAKSNVHRLLVALTAQGYVTRSADGRGYVSTLRLWELGLRVGARIDFASAGRPAAQALAGASRETVHLSVLDGGEVLYVEKIDSPLAVRADTRVGGRAPAYCSATGKALLAWADEATLETACADMRRFTARTVTGRDVLERQLAGIRERGYAVTRGEWREGVVGIAAAVVGASGRAVGALGLGGPAERMGEERVAELAPQVVAAARAIARALGVAA
jgi:DNA-binding IclR family transcriptional regulator